MDLDMCLLEDKPTVSPDESSSSSKTRLQKWEKLDCWSMMNTKRSISKFICDGVLSFYFAKEFLDAIGQKFEEFDKAVITNLLNSFTNTRHDNTGGLKNCSYC